MKKKFPIRDETVESPKRYLGANIKEWQLPGGRLCWSMSSEQYVKNAVRNLKEILKNEDRTLTLKTKASTPLPHGYHPEIDVSPELNHELANRYQQFIGILRWAVELGRIDITTEVSMMALHNALPRVGHLEALYHMFSYLSKHDHSNLVFDDQDPNITDILFPQQDWTEFYDDVNEAILSN